MHVRISEHRRPTLAVTGTKRLSSVCESVGSRLLRAQATLDSTFVLRRDGSTHGHAPATKHKPRPRVVRCLVPVLRVACPRTVGYARLQDPRNRAGSHVNECARRPGEAQNAIADDVKIPVGPERESGCAPTNASGELANSPRAMPVDPDKAVVIFNEWKPAGNRCRWVSSGFTGTEHAVRDA